MSRQTFLFLEEGNIIVLLTKTTHIKIYAINNPECFVKKRKNCPKIPKNPFFRKQHKPFFMHVIRIPLSENKVIKANLGKRCLLVYNNLAMPYKEKNEKFP